jgi:putative DNA primase/helicase
VNGLEATAELHNDGLLCLDELSQVAAEDAGKTAYLLANGQGKGRMDKYIAARRRLKWTLLFLSSGELSLHDHMKSVGKGTRAGQHVRLVEIAADAERGMGLFEEIHEDKSADAFSRSLTQATLKYYGSPIREFLRLLIHAHRLHESEDVKEYLRWQVEEFTSKHCPDGAPGEVSRVAGRFALVAAAGELATMLEITGWAEGEATAGAVACFQSWLQCRGTAGSSDDEMAVKQVRAFIEAHGSSRFQIEKEPVADRAGFRREHRGGEVEYWVLPEVFHNEVCDGFDSSIVAKALAERKYLRRSKDRIEVKVRIPEGTIWVYAIKASILTS